MIKTIHDFNKRQQRRPQPQILRVVCGAVPISVINAVHYADDQDHSRFLKDNRFKQSALL